MNEGILEKATSVILSCNHEKQLAATKRYMELARLRLNQEDSHHGLLLRCSDGLPESQGYESFLEALFHGRRQLFLDDVIGFKVEQLFASAGICIPTSSTTVGDF